MDPTFILKIIQGLTIFGFLSLCIFYLVVGGARAWYAFKPQVDELRAEIAKKDQIIDKLREDNDAWRELTNSSTASLKEILTILRERKS